MNVRPSQLVFSSHGEAALGVSVHGLLLASFDPPRTKQSLTKRFQPLFFQNRPVSRLMTPTLPLKVVSGF